MSFSATVEFGKLENLVCSKQPYGAMDLDEESANETQTISAVA